MLKALLTLFSALSISSIVSAQELSHNRWIETGRINQNKEDVHYSDTVFLVTEDRQIIDVIIGGYAYRGTIANDSLDVKKRTFYVVSNEPDEIKLKFAKLTHTFTRAPKGTVAADAAAFAERNKIPDAAAKKVNAKMLNGNWLVYKKTLREGTTVDVKTVQYLKALNIKAGKGTVTNSSNLSSKVKDIKSANIRYTNNLSQVKTLKVLRQQQDEILLEDEQNIVYFLKKQ